MTRKRITRIDEVIDIRKRLVETLMNFEDELSDKLDYPEVVAEAKALMKIATTARENIRTVTASDYGKTNIRGTSTTGSKTPTRASRKGKK